MSRLTLCVAGLLAATAVRANSPDPASLAVPQETLLRARDLVRQLGSESYRERDRATRELRRMGRHALTVLADAAAVGTDPEVKARCGELLPAAEADDMAARVAAFLADADGRFAHDLPGWEAYQAVAGADPAARLLFADMLKNADNHALLAATRGPAERLAAALTARRQLIQYRINPVYPRPSQFRPEMPTVADVGLLLLAESLAPDRSAAGVGAFVPNQYHVTTFFYQPAGRAAVASAGADAPPSPFRRLALHWLDTRDGPNGTQTALALADTLQLGPAEANKYAARVLAADGLKQNPWVKANALVRLAKNDGRDHLPAVAKLFADDSVIVKGQPANAQFPEDVLLRDVALAMAARMTGQDPVAGYGMEFQSFGTGDASKFNVNSYRFRSDAKLSAEKKRDAAFKKWAEWEAKQPKAKDKP